MAPAFSASSSLALVGVDGDDRPRLGQPGAHDRRKPDSSQADDDHALPRPDAGGVEHGADAGGHRAADEGGHLGRRGRVDGDGGLPGHHLALAEGADAGVDADRRAIRPSQPNVACLEPMAAAPWLLAQPRLVATAGAACAARRGPGQDDEIAHPQPVGVRAGTELLHDRRALVAEDDVGRPLPFAVDDVEVRVADARGDHPDEHLALPRRVELELLDGQGHARSVEDQASRQRAAHAPDATNAEGRTIRSALQD